jgi:hypothetical protein
MWAVIFLTLFAGGLIGISTLQGNQRLRRWQDAAKSCGLQVVEAFNTQLKARVGMVEVRIEIGENGECTQIVVKAPGPPDFHSVTIRPEPMLMVGREIEIGDEYFDSYFLIQGPPQLVFALLDAETRRLLFDLKAKCQLEISSGEIRGVLFRDDQIPEVLPLLLDAGKRFAQPVEALRCLARNANQDPEPGVRLQNLLLLVRELPYDPITTEMLRKACSDPIPKIRLRAAKTLGAEARAVLLELVEEDLKDDAVSAEAVSILDRELPFERTAAILDRALRGRRIQTARACLEIIGRSGAADAAGVLARVLEKGYDELALATAQALGATGSPAAEPPLILALLREKTDLQVAAAQALGRIGSVAAVLPLKEANQRFWLDLKLRQATRQAISEIQSRVEGGSPGQLSLAGADTGQLSLATDPAGQLSLGGED